MADKSVKVALVLSAVDKASMVLDKAFHGAERHAKSLEKTSKAVSEIGDKGLIAGGILTAFFGKTVEDARESVKATARLDQVFKSMGETTKEAAKGAEEFADNLQMKIGIKDDDIMAVQAKLATFKRASNEGARDAETFNRATAAAFDLQANNFGDALSNITQVGKALQNPALGAQALQRAGVINKEDLPGIKYIQAMKGIPAAQKFLLNAIEKQVKGVAERTADPMVRMEMQFHKSSKAIGLVLLPEVNKLATKLALIVPPIITFVNNNKGLIMMIAKAGVAMLAFGGTMKVLSFGLSGISTAAKGTGWVIKNSSKILELGGKTAGLAVKGYKAMQFGMFALQYATKFTVIPALQKAGMAVIEFGATLLASPITWYILAAVALGAAVYLIINNWDKISAFFAKLWTGVKVVFNKFWNWAKGMFLNYTPYGLVIKHWDKISGMFSGVWDKVKVIFTAAWKWISGLGGKFYDAGKNIVTSIGRGIVDMAMMPVKAIAAMTTKIRAYLPFSPAKTGALKDIHRVKLVETIAQSIKAKPLLNAMRNVTDSLYGQINQPIHAIAGNRGGGSGMNINLTVNLSGGATAKDADMLSDVLKKKMDKWYRDMQHQSGRVAF